ncbi:MAG: S8/S53 family peptidase [Thermoanaerobaculia bacterium]|nr:S8/S53 family peptidase [Thermoanaerobaculia bacterium]
MTPRPAIAILDVGFVKHPDLPARRVIACRDTTGRRVVPFRYGDPRSFAEHGTRTMLLAAGDGRGSGLVSPSPRARVVLMKVGQDHRVPRQAIVRAFRWLLARGAAYGIRVVLCPFGDDPERRGVRSEIPSLVRALDDRGVVVVAAAGWDPAGACVSPASSRHAIGVGGWDVEAKRPARGPRVGVIGGVLKPDLLAPAVPLHVPSLDGRSREKAGGTSFAASLVAGAALALVSKDPRLDREGVLARLAEAARRLPGQPPALGLRALLRLGIPVRRAD